MEEEKKLDEESVKVHTLMVIHVKAPKKNANHAIPLTVQVRSLVVHHKTYDL